jgi:hypothetical protein
MTFRMRDFDVPVCGDWLTLKCKQHCPHNSNADEKNDHDDTGDTKSAVGEDPEEETEKRDLDKVDYDCIAKFVYPDWNVLDRS